MRRVLVVDDEENIRVVLRTLLKSTTTKLKRPKAPRPPLEQLERFDPLTSSLPMFA